MKKKESLKVSKLLNSSMRMKNLLLFGIILSLFLFPIISSEIQTLSSEPQGECITIPQSHANVTSINLTKIRYPNATEIYDIIEMNTTNNINYFYEFCDTDQKGWYIVTTCGNGDGVLTCMDFNFNITPTGEDSNIQTSLIQILFIIFFVLVGVGFYLLKDEVDLEKLNNSIYKKYENKNYVKLVLSSLAYNILKNSFIIYYLIGLPIVILLTEISFYYGLTNVTEIFKFITIVYTVGIVVVGIIFLGYVQEWFMDLLNKVKDMEWGIE